jgi:tRNA(Ile)-lysidine synthase
MHIDLVRKTKDIIKREGLINEGDKVLVACSGGIDSVTLLFVLREISHDLPLELGVAHVNHLLRGQESNRDEDFVKGLADRFSIPCHVKKVNVQDEARKSGKSIQHAGRDIRYRFFDEIADSLHFNRIAIAHTLDDQVETFLLRIVKGTGIRGLSSIPIKRERIIRPFLPMYRSGIEEYAKTRVISFVNDSSNSKIQYERNFVRREIVPVMERLNPAVKEKIFALLRDLATINTVFDHEANEFLNKKRRDKNGSITLDVVDLLKLNEEVRYRVLLRLFQEVEPSFFPLREHIQLIEKVLKGKRPNLSATFPRGTIVRKTYGHITFTKKLDAVPVEGNFKVTSGMNSIEPLGLTLEVTEMDEQSGAIPIAPNIAYLDLEKLGGLLIRTFIAGDRFVPLGMSQEMKLKDFFIGKKIPKEKRRQIPLLVSHRDIIWVVGYRIDDRYKVTKETNRVLKVVAQFNSANP